jgi:HlyD family secretion protein
MTMKLDTASAEAALLEFESPTAALIALPTGRAARSLAWVLGGGVIACVAALSAIPVDQVVTATGTTVSSAGTMVVQSLETSILRTVEVREGQRVQAGQLLARLDPTFAETRLGADAARVTELEAEVARLTAEAQGSPFAPKPDDLAMARQGALAQERAAQRDATLRRFAAEAAALARQAEGANSDLRGTAQRLAIARDVEGRRRELFRDRIGSELNLLAATDMRLQLERQLADAQSELARLRQDLEAKQSEQVAWERGWASQITTELARASTRLAALRETMKGDTLRHSVTELRAERDAVVLSVARVSPGSVLSAGTELLSLVPADAPVEIEAELPGGDEAFAEPGQRAVVKFDSLPFTVFGAATGRVVTVSPSSFLARSDQDRNARLPTGSSPNSPYFRLRIQIEDLGRLHGLPRGFSILPGMPVTADVKVGRWTVLEYFLGRVLSPLSDGMREPT